MVPVEVTELVGAVPTGRIRHVIDDNALSRGDSRVPHGVVDGEIDDLACAGIGVDTHTEGATFVGRILCGSLQASILTRDRLGLLHRGLVHGDTVGIGGFLASSHVVVDVAVWPQSYQAQGGEGTDDDEDDDQRDLSWPKWSGASRIEIARMWYGMGLMMCRGVAVQMTVCHVGLIPCGRGLVACGGAGTLVPHTYQSSRCDKNGRVPNCSTRDKMWPPSVTPGRPA